MTQNLITNDSSFGGKLISQFKDELPLSSGLVIASGYFGAKTISELEASLVKIGSQGVCKILLGMVYFGGVSKKQLNALTDLDIKLRNDNPQNGVFITKKEYHGKVYKFIGTEKNSTIYVGSSNFSPNGFEYRRECNLLVEDPQLKDNISNYLEFLFNDKDTHNLDEVELSRKSRKKAANIGNLEEFLIKSNEYPDDEKIIGSCGIKLRVDDQPISSLNLFFGRGRKDSNGKYEPRPWYEVELSAIKDEINHEFYPTNSKKSSEKNSREGDFIMYAKNNKKFYKLKMKVHGDYGKNISSHSGGRSALGRLLKGKLEQKGLLAIGERVTSEVLHEYGNDTVHLHKLKGDRYILDF